VAQWPSDSGAIGTYTLYVDGVAVVSGTTNPATGHGTYQFFYDEASLSIGVDKVGYRPQVGSVRLMQLRGHSDIFTPEYLLWEATHPCAVLFGGDKFNYPFDTASGIQHEPSLPGYDLTLETGATSIDLTVPDCCGGTAPPWIAPSYDLDVRYIRRLRRAPHVTHENTRGVVRRFELDLERGQGLATGQGSDPIVLLRLSRDGGQTWGEEIQM